MLKESNETQLINKATLRLLDMGFMKPMVKQFFSSRALEECGIDTREYYIWLITASAYDISDYLKDVILRR